MVNKPKIAPQCLDSSVQLTPRSLQNNYLREKIDDLRSSKSETEKALDELHDLLSRAVAATQLAANNASGAAAATHLAANNASGAAAATHLTAYNASDNCDANQTLASLADLVAEQARRAAVEAKMPFTNDTDDRGDNDFNSQDANEWRHLTVSE